MTGVQGAVAPGFEPVREAFAAAQKDDPGGAQLCVYRAGEVVVDLWAGHDATHDRPYTADTLTVLMSCTKALTAICAHMLAERGLVDIDAPIARVWPEFAQGGKGDITLAQVLSHTSGLAAFDPEDAPDAPALLDPKRSAEALAPMAPLWLPGTASMYHFVTFGYLISEVARRVAGQSLGAFFAEEIATPLGLDLWIGLPADQEWRVADHIRPGPRPTAEEWRARFIAMGVDPQARLARALITAFVSTDAVIELLKTPEGHAAEISAGNGIGNARSLARAYAAAIGEVDGVRLLSPATVRRMREPLTDHLGPPAPFPTVGIRQRFGLGFELPRPIMPMLGEGSFGHPGAGGRLAWAHPESGVAAAFVCNNMLWDDVNPDPRWAWNAPLAEIVGRAGA